MPTSGIASNDDTIGPVDDRRYFMDLKRVNAGILWLTQGFIEYKTPNFLTEEYQLQQVEVSFELLSEFPFSNSVRPSDITFHLNNLELETWVSPGGFAKTP